MSKLGINIEGFAKWLCIAYLSDCGFPDATVVDINSNVCDYFYFGDGAGMLDFNNKLLVKFDIEKSYENAVSQTLLRGTWKELAELIYEASSNIIAVENGMVVRTPIGDHTPIFMPYSVINNNTEEEPPKISAYSKFERVKLD